MERKFEAHITMPREQRDLVERQASIMGWSFSIIDGDPIMGQKPYCYLTAYHTDGQKLLAVMNEVSGVLSKGGVTILREKLEEILYDTKTGHNVL